MQSAGDARSRWPLARFLPVSSSADVFFFGLQDGNTALLWALKKGHLDVAKMLMDAGADKDAADKARALR